jgi:hypothetical protein
MTVEMASNFRKRCANNLGVLRRVPIFLQILATFIVTIWLLLLCFEKVIILQYSLLFPNLL